MQEAKSLFASTSDLSNGLTKRWSERRRAVMVAINVCLPRHPAVAYLFLVRHNQNMTTLQNMTFRQALFISLVFTSAVCFGTDTKTSPEDFIRSLYRFHQPGKETPDWFGDK